MELFFAVLVNLAHLWCECLAVSVVIAAVFTAARAVGRYL